MIAGCYACYNACLPATSQLWHTPVSHTSQTQRVAHACTALAMQAMPCCVVAVLPNTSPETECMLRHTDCINCQRHQDLQDSCNGCMLV